MQYKCHELVTRTSMMTDEQKIKIYSSNYGGIPSAVFASNESATNATKSPVLIVCSRAGVRFASRMRQISVKVCENWFARASIENWPIYKNR